MEMALPTFGSTCDMSQQQVVESIVRVGTWLREQRYVFVAPTPATHRIVNARPTAQDGVDVRSIFGWSRAFPEGALPSDVLDCLRTAGLLADAGPALFTSRIRFASLGEGLFAHSAYPTDQADAVFFGPDTYRFVSFVERQLRAHPMPPGGRLLDVGCGAGPGGLCALGTVGRAELTLSDINPLALLMARANVALAGVTGDLVLSDLFAGVGGAFECIVANPPYLHDAAERTYRHGGGRLGTGLAQRIVEEGVGRLAPGGQLLLYTGAAVVDGQDTLLAQVQPALEASGLHWQYIEIDPDVFGEELMSQAYESVERIAAVGLVVQAPLEP